MKIYLSQSRKLYLASNHKTKIQCGAACVQHGSTCDGYIFDSVFRECVLCKVTALATVSTNQTMKMYVREDVAEYLETRSDILGSSKC